MFIETKNFNDERTEKWLRKIVCAGEESKILCSSIRTKALEIAKIHFQDLAIAIKKFDFFELGSVKLFCFTNRNRSDESGMEAFSIH